MADRPVCWSYNHAAAPGCSRMEAPITVIVESLVRSKPEQVFAPDTELVRGRRPAKGACRTRGGSEVTERE